MDPLRAAAELFESPDRRFAVGLWDGTVLPPARESGVQGRVVLRSPAALAALLPPSSELRASEAVLDGEIALEGDLVALLEAAARWEGPRLRPAVLAAVLPGTARAAAATGLQAVRSAAARSRGRLHSVARDRDAVQRHYDVSDAFYRLFLDEAMVYSCAYFPTGDESLEDAQQAKLALVCRKLALAPGDRFLDVGCGWGALLEHATERYGVEGVGITLSRNQLLEAERRLARARVQGRARILAADYRQLGRGDGPFAKIASVGMMEHVGRDRLDAYFQAIHRALTPGGLFLNHAIADASAGVHTVPWLARRGGGFIDRHIFPDYDLVPIADVVAAAERAGFEVRDLESLREHYAETLRRWLERLEARWTDAVAIVGERRARAYRLYLGSSAVAFRLGRISVFQLLLARRAASGQVRGIPRCRAEWHREDALPRRSATTKL